METRWRDLCVAHNVEPERLKRGRGHLYDLSALFVAEMIERGAEGKTIARALGWKNRQRVSERVAHAAQLLNRTVERPKRTRRQPTTLADPHPNSAWVRKPDLQGDIYAELDRERIAWSWWKEPIVFLDPDKLGTGSTRSTRYADPYVEEKRPAKPDTFARPWGEEAFLPKTVFGSDLSSSPSTKGDVV